MTLSYSRAEQRTKRWDAVSECWRFRVAVQLTIRRNGEAIGTASTVIEWPEYRRYGRMERGRKFRHTWEILLQGCEWTIPGLRTRTEVLDELKTVLSRSSPDSPG